MKKILLFGLMLAASLSIQASNVGYLLPNASKTASELLAGNVYDHTPLPWDVYGETQEQPERQAYEWYNGTYAADNKRFFSIKDVEDGDLLSDGKPAIDVLWINIDRAGEFADIMTNLITRANFITALSSYVQAGGNLLLTKQAVRLVFEIGRCTGEGALPSFNAGAYGTTSQTNYGVQEMLASAEEAATYKIYNGLTFTDYKYPLQTNTYTANRCCIWSLTDDTRPTFQTTHNCKILGVDGITFGDAGLVEFYPAKVNEVEYKGTVLVIGINSYDWSMGNSLQANVKTLTTNMLDYLCTKPTVNWQGWEVVANGYIGATLAAPTAPTPCEHANIANKEYSSDNANVASVDASTGATKYNGFGSTTLNAHLTLTGDGKWIPKNAVAFSESKTVTATGGDASATIGYVLTSAQTLNQLTEESSGIANPDLTAAQWFYTNYVATNKGQFVDPSADIPSDVQTLWIHSDRKELESDAYKTELGGDGFITKLTNYLAASKNLFVSKQATRLIGDLQRLGSGVYPTYGKDGDSWNYESRGPWGLGNQFTLTGGAIEHSTHAIFKDLDANPSIMNEGTHTNRNYVINIDNWNGITTSVDFEQYQEDHNCRLLGDWGNDASKYECGGLVEFYPQSEGQGTIMMLGIGAYQWIDPTDNMKTLTSNILSYLNTTSAPTVSWQTEPEDGMVDEIQNISVAFADGPVDWSYSGEGTVTFGVDPEHSVASEYKVLNLTGAGTTTITATRNGDGYALPKNVTPTSVSKEITIASNTYTRTVTNGNYGTICLPRASASLSDGMTVYQVLSNEGDGIMLEEVNAMEAGVPYFFYSTAEQITVTMTGAPVLAPQNGNGLVGNFGPASVEIPDDPDNYILGSDNTLYYIDQAGIMLGANRAYLDCSAINAGNPSNMPKRIMKIHSAPSVTTALDNTGLQDMQPLKKLVNGRLVIQRGEQIYDVTGTQVK